MPLSSESKFGVSALTEAINNLPINPTIIRELAVFKPSPQTTTHITLERRDNYLSLVSNQPRGALGDGVKQDRYPPQAFNMLHLPLHDVVLADEVQNVRAFGSQNSAETVNAKVNDKLEMMKSNLEYTREHLMLGALKGKICDADGIALIDIYQRFGLTRQVHDVDASATSELGKVFDTILTAQGKMRKGESVNGWVVLASEQLLQAIIYHKSVKEAYLRYQEARTYRESGTNVAFEFKGIQFIQYDHEFESGVKIDDGQGIILPLGTKNTFREYFAPANMNKTVNSLALPYYASREVMKHDTGWDLHAQSNPLPLVLRPELVATLKVK